MTENETNNEEESKQVVPEQVNDPALHKIEQILASVQPGHSIAIYRVRPAWCKGYLERIEMLDAEPIDLDYLAETWGGEVLRLRICDATGTYRGGADIPMYSYRPKFRGKFMTRNQYENYDDVPKGASIVGQQVAQPAPPQNNFENMFNMLRQMRTEDLKMFGKMFESQPTDPPVVGNGIQNLVELAGQMKELKGLFGDAEGALNVPAGDDQAALFGTIADVAKALLQRPAQAAPRLVQHPNARSQNRPNVQQNDPRAQNPGRNIAAELAAMSPDQAADVALSALSRMPNEKKEQAIAEIIGRLGESAELDFEQGEGSELEGEFEGDDDPRGAPEHSDSSEIID